MSPSARYFVLAMGAAALLAPPAQSQVSNRFPLLPSHAFAEGGAIGRFVDNGLEIRASRPVSRFPFGRPLAAAARVDVSTVLREGPVNASFGLAFNRRPDGTPWLRFLISANGLYTLTGSDGTAHIAWRASPAIRQGAGMRNDIAFDIQGRTLRLYINGIAVEQWGAPADLSGEFGYDVNDAAEIRFDRQIVIESEASSPPTAADFVIEAADTFRNNLGTGRFLDGGLEIRAGEQGVNKYPFVRNPADPSRFEVSTVLRDGVLIRGFGIVLSPDTTGERDVYFLITGNGQYKFRVAGTDVIPWQAAAAIRQGLGQRNDIAIELRGSAARLFVNGTLVNEWSGSTTLMGRLGLSVLRDLEVRFDRARYLPLAPVSISSSAPPPAAAPRPRGFVLQPGMAVSDSLATERVVDGAFEILARRNIVSTPFADSVGSPARIEARTTILRDTIMVSRTESGQELFTRRSYGLMFSGPDTLTRVQFLINGFGEYSLQLANRTLAIPWTANANVRRGDQAQNVLAVEVQGRVAALYINGVRVNAWTAPRELVGTIGFVAGQNQHVRFDNISVQASPPR